MFCLHFKLLCVVCFIHIYIPSSQIAVHSLFVCCSFCLHMTLQIFGEDMGIEARDGGSGMEIDVCLPHPGLSSQSWEARREVVPHCLHLAFAQISPCV